MFSGVLVLYNGFNDKETICIVYSIVTHLHLITDCRMFPQHYIGQMDGVVGCFHSIILEMDGDYCYLNALQHVFVAISLYLSVIDKRKNNSANLYLTKMRVFLTILPCLQFDTE